ncbi:hypothetical protein L6164_011386 [Bauhinia variegata]|uniref:Uncharacterized protein n=1 Tax=Bauhinia variegata TaxID=167791 RepID=A0ACB9P6M4_BAUVA|nr:hypothetical protein L6164_011386 [Bauhinia variegata]
MIVERNSGRDIPIVHKVIKVHDRRNTGKFLSSPKQYHIMGRAVGFLPYVGWMTIIMTEKPILKYILIGALGLLAITSKD